MRCDMHRRFTKKNAANALKYLLLLIGGAVSVMPMVYMLSLIHISEPTRH